MNNKAYSILFALIATALIGVQPVFAGMYTNEPVIYNVGTNSVTIEKCDAGATGDLPIPE
ncbi:MAG: hypothetical protein GY774_11755, partial [Planctomycetes bacterium]|nr:hypothetical protein [Planctomycetota bacterium]